MVLISSFPYTINWSKDHVPAILHMAHSSQDEGRALAKVLFGDYSPGGHLASTWPASERQLPPMTEIGGLLCSWRKETRSSSGWNARREVQPTTASPPVAQIAKRSADAPRSRMST